MDLIELPRLSIWKDIKKEVCATQIQITTKPNSSNKSIKHSCLSLGGENE
jgi:hypothetical protein